MKLEHYKKLLAETAKMYTFEKINKDLRIDEIKSSSKSICFLRHDIDFSPSSALKIAQVEAEEGISSTFTILLTGQYYSPFEKKTKDCLKEIISYGHEIGLHFDPTAYDINSESHLDKFVKKEARILEDIMQSSITMFSFHNTNDFSMSCRREKYGNLVNAYSKFFLDDVEYTSDSNGYWRFRTWKELLSKKHKIIQILTHPIWWGKNRTLPPFETVIQNCLERFRNEISDYTQLFNNQDSRINKSALTKFLHST